jgi:hypothetical protein
MTDTVWATLHHTLMLLSTAFGKIISASFIASNHKTSRRHLLCPWHVLEARRKKEGRKRRQIHEALPLRSLQSRRGDKPFVQIPRRHGTSHYLSFRAIGFGHKDNGTMMVR